MIGPDADEIKNLLKGEQVLPEHPQWFPNAKIISDTGMAKRMNADQ